MQIFIDRCGIISYIWHGYCEIRSVVIKFCKWIIVHQANIFYACMHDDSNHNTYSFIWLLLYCILSNYYKPQFIPYMADILWFVQFLFNCKSSHELLDCQSAILMYKHATMKVSHKWPFSTWNTKVLRIRMVICWQKITVQYLPL